jgi:hypothetical protein
MPDAKEKTKNRRIVGITTVEFFVLFCLMLLDFRSDPFKLCTHNSIAIL